jgi:hypothetical protein
LQALTLVASPKLGLQHLTISITNKKTKNLLRIRKGKIDPYCGHLVKEMVLVKRQCAIAPHVFQQLHLSNMMSVSNCSMGNLADEIVNFLYDNMLMLMVKTYKPQQMMPR